jgi:ketosteroid isomerase-like protein
MKNLLLLSTCVMFLACTKAVDTDVESELIRAQLKEIAEMSALDRPTAEMTNEYLRYFAAEPTLQPADGDAIHGRDAIARFYNNAFENIKILSNNYEEPVITVNGATAVRRYTGIAVFAVADQGEQVTAKNQYTDVLIKEGDEWKMLLHSWVPVALETDIAAAKQSLFDTFGAMGESIEAGNLESFVSHYTDSPIHLPPGAPRNSTRAAIESFLNGTLGLYEVQGEPEINFSDDASMAFVYGTYAIRANEAQGLEAIGGRFITVWKKAENGWRCIVDIWNTDDPRFAHL